MAKRCGGRIDACARRRAIASSRFDEDAERAAFDVMNKREDRSGRVEKNLEGDYIDEQLGAQTSIDCIRDASWTSDGTVNGKGEIQNMW